MEPTKGSTASGARTLSVTEVRDALMSIGEVLRAELSRLPAPVLPWHPARGEWCAKEVLGHLLEAEERGFAGRIRTMLAVEHPALARWDPDEVARARGDCGRELSELLDRFLAVRDASATLVATLTPDDLGRSGLHPVVGALRVQDLLHEWVHHDRNHLRQILANVQAFVWPAMGNAQRFSGSPPAGPS
jgi:DinB family protein